MDAAYRSNRRYPGYTDAELEASIARTQDEDRREDMVAELAARRSGRSKAFATPQVGGGSPIIGRFLG